MIAPFSFWWFFLLGAVITALVVLRILLRQKSLDFRRRVITGIGIFGIAAFVAYRFGLWAYPSYDFVIWNELPLHLCNIAVFLLPIASAWNVRWLQSYCFLNCSIGAVAGLILATEEFCNIPLLSPLGIGYYGTHCLILFLCLSFVVFGIYVPRFRDLPISIGLLFASAGLIHCINLILRATVCPEANYFYTFGLPGNSIIEAVYNILPYDFFYEFLFLIPYIPIASLIILPFELRARKKNA